MSGRDDGGSGAGPDGRRDGRRDGRERGGGPGTRRTDGRAVDVIDGDLVKPLLVLSVPIVLSNLLQVGYNLADTFWVGRLGEDAVAAISFSWAIVFLLITLAGGFSVAGTVLVAQHKGAGNLDEVDHVAGQTIGVVVLVSAALSVVGYALAPTLLTLVNAEPGTTVFALSLTYTRTMFLGIPFVFGFFIFQALLQGWGDTRTPLYLMALGVTLNVVADPFFILGFQDNVVFDVLGLTGLQSTLYSMTGFAGFGVQGAALATITTRGLGAVLGVGLLLSGHVGLQPTLADFLPRLETVKKMVAIGAPASVEQSTQSLSVTILTGLVALAGTEAVAAYGIGTRITSLVFLPAMGLARGTETVVGQNLGAAQADRAKRAVLASSAIIGVVLVGVTVLVYRFAPVIVGVFITGENAAAVVDVGVDYLRIVGLTFACLGVFRIVQGGFRGSGSTRIAMVLSVLGLLVVRVPLAYLLLAVAGLGSTGVWYGIAISNVVVVVAAGAWFLRGTWTDAVVEGGGPRPGPPGAPTERPTDSADPDSVD